MIGMVNRIRPLTIGPFIMSMLLFCFAIENLRLIMMIKCGITHLEYDVIVLSKKAADLLRGVNPVGGFVQRRLPRDHRTVYIYSVNQPRRILRS